jgi:hypothetical protein
LEINRDVISFRNPSKIIPFLKIFSILVPLCLCFLVPPVLPAAQVSLAWDPNAETDLAGYKIYIGYAPRTYSWSIDAGKQTQGTVTGLEDGNTYYLALTAYNTGGSESGFSNEVIYATPAGAQSTLTVTRTGTGVGTVNATGIDCGTDCSEVYTTGSSVTLTAAPNAGSSFGGWGGACSGTAGTCTVTMSAARSVTATFTAATYTITASAGTNGSITPGGTTTVAYGGSRTFTIRPASGYQVGSVTVDGSPAGQLTSYTFSDVKSNHTIAATFTRVVYSSTNRTLKISKIGSGNGLVTTSPSGTVFRAGTEVTLTAVPEDGSTFVEWSGSCSGSEPTCTVVLNTNMSVTAAFGIFAPPVYNVYLPIIIQ